jgi:hypothetical protein
VAEENKYRKGASGPPKTLKNKKGNKEYIHDITIQIFVGQRSRTII